MTAPKLTDWFPPEVKPVHVGVYQTRDDEDDIGIGFQYWDGSAWGFFSLYAKRAYEDRAMNSMWQSPQWRGLANNPKRMK